MWDNVNYSINEQTKEIKEDIIGSFTQIPLRLAWAITIHKSQYNFNESKLQRSRSHCIINIHHDDNQHLQQNLRQSGL